MTTTNWSAPAALSSNLISTELNSLANGSESALITYDNSSNLDLYGAVTIKLGSITTGSSGSVTLRVYASDGTNVSDKTGGGDTYTLPLTSGSSAKIVIAPMVRLYPFSLRFTVTNSAGVSLAASGNELYIRPYNESAS